MWEFKSHDAHNQHTSKPFLYSFYVLSRHNIGLSEGAHKTAGLCEVDLRLSPGGLTRPLKMLGARRTLRRGQSASSVLW